MIHRFSWRLGLAVIGLLLLIFALIYPSIKKSQTVPVRQTTEIRTDSTADDSTAREAIERDSNR